MINESSLIHISKKRIILMQEEGFVYVLPCEELRHLLSNFTITFPNSTKLSDEYTIMPHGSVTLVLFYHHFELHSFLFGPTTKKIKIGDLANQCDSIFIIEFQPAGFYPFIKINQNDLTDKIVPFSFLANSLDTALKNIFLASTSIDALLFAFENKLLQSILFQYPKGFVEAMNVIIQGEGKMASTDISNHVFYSARHLNRLFHLYIGMGIKSFSRLVRINKSIKLLNDKANTLEVIGEQLGYYDVSHFVKDFKMVCTMTPQEYRTNMSDFYSELAKF